MTRTKILVVEYCENGCAVIEPDVPESIRHRFVVSADYARKHKPQPGGYFSRDENGVLLDE